MSPLLGSRAPASSTHQPSPTILPYTLLQPSSQTSKPTNPPPFSQASDGDQERYQFLLFSILGVVLAFATLIVAYLQYLQYRRKYVTASPPLDNSITNGDIGLAPTSFLSEGSASTTLDGNNRYEETSGHTEQQAGQRVDEGNSAGE